MKNVRCVINEVRKMRNGKKYVPCYDYCGGRKEDLLLPIYYNNPASLKLCFPAMYYTEEEVIRFETEIQKVVDKNNLGLKATMEPHYIGGFHCRGWCIRVK